MYNILKPEHLTIINSTHNPEDILGVDSHIQIIIDNQNGDRIISYSRD